MNLNHYLDPLDTGLLSKNKYNISLYSEVSFHTIKNEIKDIEQYNIVIIGVPDKESSLDGTYKIREKLYNLAPFNNKSKILDIGNIKTGTTRNDLIIGLRDVLVEIISLKIMPVIIGLTEEAVLANYFAFDQLEKKINLVSIDSKINIYENKEIEYRSPLWDILVKEKQSVFSFTNIGYQTHFLNNDTLKLLSGQNHLFYRLAYTRSNLKQIEPVLRDADTINLDVSAIRQSDAPGQKHPSPNGYYGEEICQLSRYAGMSCRLSSFSVNGYSSVNDINNQTSHLIAQIIWYFIDAYNNRIKEYPLHDENDYKKFIVNLDSSEYELIFYKSKNTERWWVEVPSFLNNSVKNILLSCTYNDYVRAGNGDIPERWLNFYQKIN